MAGQATDKQKLAQEKRDVAHRARRLALLQTGHEAARLTQFAAELEQEAEVLEQSAASPNLPLGPGPGPSHQVQQQQQQQQQTAAPATAARKKD